MNLPIEKDFLKGVPQTPFADGIGEYRFIVAHETAVNNDSIKRNKSVFGNGGWKNMSAFVHYFVDHTGIWQSSSLKYTAWGAGSKANPYAVHVELCRRDGQEEFQQSYKNYVNLLAWLLNRKGLSFKRFVTFYLHADVTKKLGGTTHTDPVAYLKSHGVSVDQFIKDVSDAVDGKEITSAPGRQEKAQTVSSSNGGSVVDYMKEHGMDYSYDNRAKLAKQYGIKGYEGTADQNVTLLDAIKDGEPSSGSNGEKVTLPASSNSWRAYPVGAPPTKGNEKGKLNPAKFGGLSYNVLGHPQKDVVTIESGDFGKVNIYVGPGTGANVSGKSGGSSGEKVTLPASSNSWRIYPTNKSPTKGNEKGKLNPAKFGGLTYDVIGHPQADVVTINSGDFGKGNIYVGSGTGAIIS